MQLQQKNILVLLFFLGCSFLAFSQKDKLEEADKMFDRYAYIDAREVYLEVAENGYESENLFKKLADSYYFNGELEKALKWYEALYNFKTEGLETDYLFRYAMALKSDKQYAKADEIMLEFDALNKTDSRVAMLKKDRDYLEIIEMQSGKFDIEDFPINSDLSDFSPIFYGEKQLLFASNRPTSSSVKRIHEWNNQPYLDIYKVGIDLDSLEVKGEPELLSKTINSKFHEASAVITKDGLRIYFTRNNYNKKKYGESEEGINFLKIYTSTRESLDADWQTPKELPFNSDEFSTAHPALSPDEKSLYFSSDRPGTFGMSDIYRVEINEDGSYSEPENLGANINTEGRENFPYISKENKIYFSSDGHIGLGGLDVFVAEIDKKDSIGEVFNIGRPINSSKDDFSFIIDSKRKKGFFASNREAENREDNIYAFQQKEKVITGCKQYITGVVSDTDTGNPIENATVELFDEDLELISTQSTNKEGEYKLKVKCNKRYIIRASKEGYSTKEDIFQSDTELEKKIDLDIQLKKGSGLGVAKAEKGDDLSKLLQLDPIYFDLDESEIRPDAEVELQKVIAVLRQYPAMKIDIRSHTDSRAGDAYNKILSEKRAKATLNYLKNKGINKDRLSGKGYGETQLINNCGNNSNCTEEQHQLNRRSEFIILNKNETPQEVRKQIEKRQKTVQVKKSESKEEILEDSYDFSGNQEVFTVQIAASKKHNSIIKFPKVDKVFYHVYPDGYRRYYSKQFRTKAAAKAYKFKLRKKGIKDAFIVRLKGENRL